MRLLFIADGRSTTTISWLNYWIMGKDEVHLVSTYPCKPLTGLASFHVIPTSFSGVMSETQTSTKKKLLTRLRAPFRIFRYFLEPARLPGYQRQFLKILETIRPEIVHALRIPFEGMLSYRTPTDIPFCVSVWGNDLTLHARGSPFMASYTRYTLHRADVLFADSSRDIRLGQARGLNLNADKFVLPGAGGIDLQRIDASTRHVELPEELPNAYVVVNARGHRPGSLRQDNFFKTIPIILKKIPDVVFVCPPWRGDAQAEKWMKWTGFQERVRLWPKLTQPQLWALFKKSSIYISPSLHDGVPNSLLEAMACGCFPVVGNIESMQEWIVNGVNGFLVNARDPEFIAEAVISALNNPALLAHSEKINYDLVAERGNYELNMQRVRELYTKKIRGI